MKLNNLIDQRSFYSLWLFWLYHILNVLGNGVRFMNLLMDAN